MKTNSLVVFMILALAAGGSAAQDANPQPTQSRLRTSKLPISKLMMRIVPRRANHVAAAGVLAGLLN